MCHLYGGGPVEHGMRFYGYWKFGTQRFANCLQAIDGQIFLLLVQAQIVIQIASVPVRSVRERVKLTSGETRSRHGLRRATVPCRRSIAFDEPVIRIKLN